MRLVLVTNYWNHYQGALGRALADRFGRECFRMLLCNRLDEERRELGWQECEQMPPWVIGPPDRMDDLAGHLRMVLDADVALMGASPGWMQRQRARTGKLTFIAMERIWKTPPSWRLLLQPRLCLHLPMLRAMVHRPNVHYLAVGAYAAMDMRSIGAGTDRMWTWGYFPHVSDRLPDAPECDTFRIFWAGRMIGWKRVEVLLRACAMLGERVNWHLGLAGTGAERKHLEELVQEHGVASRVTFHGPLTPEEVQRRMRASDVYVMPSDRNEGWGVVANEAVSEGAVLVANEQAGAAPLLIEQGITGFLFRDGDARGLADVLERLATDRESRLRLRGAAWRKLLEAWTPSVAAERFAALCSALLNGQPIPPYAHGPCAKC